MMQMKHKDSGRLAGEGVIISAGVGILHLSGFVPLWAYAAVLVLMFPVISIGICLWWMAKGGMEDIPFIGY
jgi:hypothetical protein